MSSRNTTKLQKNKNSSQLATDASSARYHPKASSDESARDVETATDRLIEVNLDRDFDNIYEDMMEDANLMCDIETLNKGPDGEDQVLRFTDFCMIKKLIKKYTHPTMAPSLKTLI